MSSTPIRVAESVEIGGTAPLAVIAGPDSIESLDHALRMAEALARETRARGVELVFKASFDKANRSSIDSFRGVGIDEGLRVLSEVRARTGVPVTTDFHTPDQAAAVGDAVDLIQVPAFLCRQTDMLVAAGRTGLPVNVKKGQFLAPQDAAQIVGKVRSTGNDAIVLTERGTTFGYHNLVVDFRSLRRMADLGVAVCFDATHSVQLPGGLGHASGGERRFIPDLARAAVAVGVDAVFVEVHDAPDEAPCDGPNQLPLDAFGPLLDRMLAIERAVGRRR